MTSAYGRLGAPGAIQAVLVCFKAGWINIDGTAVRDLPAPKRGDLAVPYRVYLYAFDLYTHAHGDEEKHAAYSIMQRAARDAGIPLGTRSDNGRDLVDRLAAWMRSQSMANVRSEAGHGSQVRR